MTGSDFIAWRDRLARLGISGRCFLGPMDRCGPVEGPVRVQWRPVGALRRGAHGSLDYGLLRGFLRWGLGDHP